MSTGIAATSLLVLLATTPRLQAADQHSHGTDSHMQQSGEAKSFSGHGRVNRVDASAGKVNISHDPIKELKWPKMTMDFQAHDAALLKDIKPGIEVNFELMKISGSYHIMKITPVQ
ncbi:MAG TPA: copper-binding protein [Burkholderiales bacterium]|nr:copper-binding protein [Burkholderiales bacterium]